MDQNADYAECVRVDQERMEAAEAKQRQEEEAACVAVLQVEMGRIYRVRMYAYVHTYILLLR